MAAAADTNVLVRLLLDDDEEQARAARAFQRAQAPLFVSHVVLAELSWVLTSGYGFSRDKLHTVLQMLLDTRGIAVQEPEVVLSALSHFSGSRADFSDCLILAIAQNAGSEPLGTFDRRLGKLTGAGKLGRKR
jgi:predicted nucleic-acid-binding protein